MDFIIAQYYILGPIDPQSGSKVRHTDPSGGGESQPSQDWQAPKWEQRQIGWNQTTGREKEL